MGFSGPSTQGLQQRWLTLFVYWRIRWKYKGFVITPLFLAHHQEYYQ